MVLIFAAENDYSAKKVMEWLRFFSIKFMCVHNGEISIIKGSINASDKKKLNSNLSICINDKIIDIEDITAIWYRSAQVRLTSSYKYRAGQFKQDSLDDMLAQYLDGHCRTQEDYLAFLFSRKRTLGSNAVGSANKLASLTIANELGIDVPKTIFAQENQFEEMAKPYNGLIVKSIDITFSHTGNGKQVMSYTDHLDRSLIRSGKSATMLAFAQAEIKKRYEIRSFYIKGKFYSSAVLSQTNEFTKIDHRKYHAGPRNRTVTAKLPEDLESRLHQLCTILGYDTGSFDLIKGQDDKFYFLEINPVGQYVNPAKHSNYNINKIIAEYLAYGE